MGFVWITGANGAVGSALVRRSNSSDIPLVFIAQDQKKLGQLADTLQPPSVLVCPADVTDRSGAQLTIEAGVIRLGAPAGLTYCVRSTIIKPLYLTSRDDLKQTLDANLFSAWNALRSLMQQAVHHKMHASVILIGPITATVGFPNREAIISAKAAIAALTQSAVAIYADRNIRVNCIHSGLASSAMSSRLTSAPTVTERLAKADPLNRLGQGDDAVAPAEFLLSPATSWITGQQIDVDGGHGRLVMPPKS